MKQYKGYKYFLDKDGYWKVMLERNRFFIVALDDSKLFGNKKIVHDKNNEKTCRKYIDILTEF